MLQKARNSDLMATNKQKSKSSVLSSLFDYAKKDIKKATSKKIPDVIETVQGSIPIYSIHENRDISGVIHEILCDREYQLPDSQRR